MFAGGGTGGHLFPAIAVAEKIRAIIPESDILFIGTKSKIEGSVVPKLGFKFKSIWIKGFARKITFENILFPLKLFVSLIQSVILNLKFKPNVAIGSGGYVSGPAIWASYFTGSKIILLEQNSYPGITTRILAKYADRIYLTFEDSKKYFSNQSNLVVSGTPVREELGKVEKKLAVKKFNLDAGKKVVLILGGSLGAETINKATAYAVGKLKSSGIQIIWQTGKNYFQHYKNLTNDSIKIYPFIENMNYAYSACDLVVARAGATTIAEIIYLGLPSVLIPSPNVAANHQYYNAKSVVDNNAAVMIYDNQAESKLTDTIVSLISNEEKLNGLKKEIEKLNKENSAELIAKFAIKLAEESNGK